MMACEPRRWPRCSMGCCESRLTAVPPPSRSTRIALNVQLGLDLLAGLLHHAPEAGERVAQRGHEQPWPAVLVAAGHPGQCTLAVVDLHLLAGQEAQAVELLGLLRAQLAHEALDGVVLPSKTSGID